MSLTRLTILDGFQERPIYQGDLVGQMELLKPLTTVGAGTITADIMSTGIINRTGPIGGYIDTTDTAANIVATLAGSAGGVQSGTTFRLRYINTVAFAMTLAAGTGVTLGSNVNCAASSCKEYLVTVTNGTLAQQYAANTTNASATITGLTPQQVATLGVGMLVTGTGIPASTTITSINAAGSLTLSANATATGTLFALTFNPTVRIDSLGQMLL